jgi:hypothetical protein
MSMLDGKWSGEGVEMEFASDGTVKVTVLERTEIYKYRFLDSHTIEIDIPGLPKAEQIYEIEFTNDALTLSQSGILRAYKRLAKYS